MKELEEIRRLLREITDAGKAQVIQGIVRETGKDTFSVEVDEGVVISEVMSNVVVGADSGVILTPEVGSPVVIVSVDGGNRYQLLQATQLRAVRVRVGNSTMDVNSARVIFHEGKQGGAVLVDPLRSELHKIDANTEVVRGLFQLIGSILDGIAPGTSAAINSALSGMVKGDTSKLENDKLQQ